MVFRRFSGGFQVVFAFEINEDVDQLKINNNGFILCSLAVFRLFLGCISVRPLTKTLIIKKKKLGHLFCAPRRFSGSFRVRFFIRWFSGGFQVVFRWFSRSTFSSLEVFRWFSGGFQVVFRWFSGGSRFDLSGGFVKLNKFQVVSRSFFPRVVFRGFWGNFMLFSRSFCFPRFSGQRFYDNPGSTFIKKTLLIDNIITCSVSC